MRPIRLPHIRLNGIDLPILLFMLSAALGVLPAYDRSLSWLPLGVLLAGGALYLGVSRGVKTRSGLFIVARMAVLAGALLGLFFITQAGYLQPGEKIGSISRLAAWVSGYFPRATFWQPHPNSVATFLESLLFLGVGLLVLERGKWWRLAAGLAVGLIALGLLFSVSRGAWLGIGLAGVIWLAVHYRPARWVALGLGILVIGLGAFVLLQGNIRAIERVPLVDRVLAPIFSREDRLDVYRGSLSLIQDMPFRGIGLGGQFAAQYSRYVLLIQVPYLTYSHNLYLEAWLEQGLLGIFALVWLIAALLWNAARYRGDRGDALFESSWLGMLAFFLHGLSDARPYVDLWCWLPFFLALGLYGSMLSHQPANDSKRLSQLLPLGVAVLIVGAALVALPVQPGAWQAETGCIEQARAALNGTLSGSEKELLTGLAVEDLKVSAAVDDDQRTAHFRLGLLLSDEKRFSEALKELEKACEADSQDEATIKALGLAYVWVGEVEKAESYLEKVPGITEELNVWGWWWSTNGEPALARYAYQASLRLSPDQPEVQQALQMLNEATE